METDFTDEQLVKEILMLKLHAIERLLKSARVEHELFVKRSFQILRYSDRLGRH